MKPPPRVRPTIQDAYESTNASEIDAIEVRLGHSLPSFYRSFLLRQNGGVFRHGVVYTRVNDKTGDISQEGGVDLFYGVNAECAYADIMRHVERSGFDKEGVLPIASDAFGNDYCLALSPEKERGKIVFVDHENGEVESESIATNFEDFLNSLSYSALEDDDYWYQSIPVFQSVAWGDLEGISQLLDEPDSFIKRDENGRTLLHCAAKYAQGHLVPVLLEKGVNPTEVDSQGLSALHLASRSESLDSCRWILESGVDIDSVDNEGFTPLMHAVRSGSPRVARLLLSSGADMAIKSNSGLDALKLCRGAVQEDDILPLLLKHGATSGNNSLP